MKNRIEILCKKYTNLTDEDISIIQMEAVHLKEYCDSMKKDVFIDCPCTEKMKRLWWRNVFDKIRLMIEVLSAILSEKRMNRQYFEFFSMGWRQMQ